MNGNTRELLKRVLDFIQIHRDLEEFTYTRARPPPIHPPSQICGPSYNLDHVFHGDLGLTLEQREEQGKTEKTHGLEAHLSEGAGEMYLYDLGGDRSDRSHRPVRPVPSQK